MNLSVLRISSFAGVQKTAADLFEAFDELWKGDRDVPLGAEKHWGMFNVDRTPKNVMGE